MARISSNELLAASLERALQAANQSIIRSERLTRADRERLIRSKYLRQIIHGWYVLCPAYVDTGESTLWHVNFWEFVRQYLEERFNDQYCLSPEASMDLWLGKNYIPSQVVVIARKGGTQSLKLPHNTSLMIYEEKKNFPLDRTQHHGLKVFPFEYALCKMPPAFYSQQSTEAAIALHMLESPDSILYYLLKERLTTAAGRVAGALRHIKNSRFADAILLAMRAAGFQVVEKNPFDEKPLLLTGISISPYAARLAAMWERSRATIAERFPEPATKKSEKAHFIEEIDTVYAQDAYHSLSIEGYEVSEELMKKIAEGKWQPEADESDRQQRNAMAAKGYYEAFRSVKDTIMQMSVSSAPVDIMRDMFSSWYAALFSPSVAAGIVRREHLAGYRRQPVYIRNAMHVPPPFEAVGVCMDTLFRCAANEPHPGVRAVLMHWLVGFVHPFVDGNGRMARFAMNALLVSQGYPWTIIHVKKRNLYMKALEKASIEGDLTDFTDFIVSEMKSTEAAE